MTTIQMNFITAASVKKTALIIQNGSNSTESISSSPCAIAPLRL